MANTFTSLHYHIVFSTKNREPWLRDPVIKDVWSYLGGICRTHKIKTLQIGGVADHVHLLLGIPPTLALSDAVKRLKGESSKWIRATLPDVAGFAWQDGYGGFTVSQSQLSATMLYIQNQREHHQKMTFESEYRKFLQLHEIEANEAYIFG